MSFYVQDKYGITEDVFFSLPCVVGHGGIISVLSQNLTDLEVQKLKTSAQTLNEVQQGIKFQNQNDFIHILF